MAISEKKQGSNTYIIYGYVVGGEHKRIYCGKKGLASTTKNLAKAKTKHLEEKMAYSKKKLIGKKKLHRVTH